MLGLSAANFRQLFHRAQAHLAERRRRFQPAREAQQRLLACFLRACQQGDIAALTETLAEEVIAWPAAPLPATCCTCSTTPTMR